MSSRPATTHSALACPAQIFVLLRSFPLFSFCLNYDSYFPANHLIRERTLPCAHGTSEGQRLKRAAQDPVTGVVNLGNIAVEKLSVCNQFPRILDTKATDDAARPPARFPGTRKHTHSLTVI